MHEDKKRVILRSEDRMLVLIRDDLQCQSCGKKGVMKRWKVRGLEVHHINGPINNDWNNLITLCLDCHLYEAHDGDYKNPPIKTYVARNMDLERVRNKEREIKTLEMAKLMGITKLPTLNSNKVV